MTVAFSIADAKDLFTVKELPFAFLLLTTLIFVLGSGKFSVDKLIQKV
jgi:putative oxidoreductase